VTLRAADEQGEARADLLAGPLDMGGGTIVMLCDVDLSFPDAQRTHTIEVARGFQRAGLEVQLIARGPDPRLPGVRFQSARREGRLLRAAMLTVVAGRLLWRCRDRSTRFYVREKWTCLPSLMLARALRYRVVLQVDGVSYAPGSEYHLSRTKAWISRELVALSGRLANGVLAVTPQIAGHLVALARVAPERIEVIPNGVDTDFFAPMPREAAIAECELDPGCTYITFCGGMYPWTDFDAMLQAFRIARERRADLRLLLIGDGPERPRIESEVRRLRLDREVLSVGRIHDRSLVRAYLCASSVMLLLYRADQISGNGASPIKLGEYLSCGRAVVSVDVPSITEVVQASGGGIVVSGDPTEISSAIDHLLENGRADQLGAAARRYAEASLSWRQVIERTLPLFER
jgi:glycosyltransferase involved in cell wall biosynthesis